LKQSHARSGSPARGCHPPSPAACALRNVDEGEWREVFVAFLAEALDAAAKSSNQKARRLVFEVDDLDAILTCIVTDEVRSQDERDVFKLVALDWAYDSGELGEDEVPEDEDQLEEETERTFQRFRAELSNALGDLRLHRYLEALSDRGFTLWIMRYSLDDPWADLAPLV
jgi:hypothetical protein